MALKSVSFKKTRGKHMACFKQALYCVTIKQMEDHEHKKNESTTATAQRVWGRHDNLWKNLKPKDIIRKRIFPNTNLVDKQKVVLY